MTLPELCECSENPINNMPNNDNTTKPSASSPSDKIGKALKAVLQQASSQGRITCSLTSCVELLSTRPDDVMLCVMPLLTHPDAAASIQSTLIRAVCMEHNIRVLSVDCDVKLAKTVYFGELDLDLQETRGVKVGEEVDDNFNQMLKSSIACCLDTWMFSGCDKPTPVMGSPCVLVQYPTDGASTQDEEVAMFCKQHLFGCAEQEDAYIELPD